MRSFTKVICSIGGTMFGIGCIMLIVGLSMGGRPQGVSLRWNNGPQLHFTDASSIGEPRDSAGRGTVMDAANAPAAFTSLIIELGGAEVVLQEGDKNSLTVSGPADYTNTIENGVWRIENYHEDILWGGRAKLKYTITVAKGTVLDDLTLSIGAGTLTASDLSCETINVNVGAGVMNIKNLRCTGNSNLEVGLGTLSLDGALGGRTALDVGMGTAKLLLDRPADYGYACDAGVGSAEVDGHSAGGINCEISNNTGADVFFAVTCGVGSAKITFR